MHNMYTSHSFFYVHLPDPSLDHFIILWHNAHFPAKTFLNTHCTSIHNLSLCISKYKSRRWRHRTTSFSSWQPAPSDFRSLAPSCLRPRDTWRHFRLLALNWTWVRCWVPRQSVIDDQGTRRVNCGWNCPQPGNWTTAAQTRNLSCTRNETKPYIDIFNCFLDG